MSGRYYWLKLKRDFFKRHDIRIVESMPNGKDYILFYLKMLCESVDHEGALRFSDTIPYNEQMLATLTETNVDIVRSAVKIFSELGMMEVMDDGTYFMTQVQNMIGSASNTTGAIKQKRYRERLKELRNVTDELPDGNETVTERYESKSKSKSKSNIESKRFTPPSREEVQAYCEERKNNVDADSFVDFYSSKGWMVGKNPMKDWKACVRTWERRDTAKRKEVEDRNKFNHFEQHEYDFDELERDLLS